LEIESSKTGERATVSYMFGADGYTYPIQILLPEQRRKNNEDLMKQAAIGKVKIYFKFDFTKFSFM
jgi:hypothetical protein